MKNVSKTLNDQRFYSFKSLTPGSCTILMQNDKTGKIKKYKGKCIILGNGQKIIHSKIPSEENNTTLMYHQNSNFLSEPLVYSVYETKKHFVKNEAFLDKDLNHHLLHTYKKKSKTLENNLNKEFGKPTLTKKHGRVWH